MNIAILRDEFDSLIGTLLSVVTDDFDGLLKPSPLDVPIAVTRFPTTGAGRKSETFVSMRQLAFTIQNEHADRKGGLPWFKLGRFGNHRSGKGSLRNNANVICVTGVEGGWDGGEISLGEAERLVRADGIAALFFPMPPSTESSPRWRIFAPLSAEREPQDRDRYFFAHS
ncbi:hypothetical protein ACFOKI_15150 [Sphingomonas qilianensis]|uniref:Uncharacterized protein n=1 Tax=Sphingomonas qilianensis TaxID=1736690 RepID=A0ABU9XM84_9SPHN